MMEYLGILPVFSSFFLTVSGSITLDQYTELKQQCDAQLLNGRGGNIPLLVRLAFHDCVGDGGCNGCVDHNNPENAGLQDINNALITAYNSNAVNSSAISLADFVAMCGVAACETAYQGNYNGLSKFSFKTGRVTKVSCGGDNDVAFPNPLHGYTETVTWLKTQFGLRDDREAIVLIGAHTLGDAQGTNSGFRGPWTRNPHVLDKEYYSVLLMAEADQWRQLDAGGGKHQWEEPRPAAPPPGRRKRDTAQEFLDGIHLSKRKKRQAGGMGPLMMLNADMALLKDINVNTNGVSQTCADDVSGCNESPGRSVVQELAADNTAFIDEFIVAFTKMIEKVPAGAPALTAIGGQDDSAAQATSTCNLLLMIFLFIVSWLSL